MKENKISVIVDSSSGLSKKEAEDLELYFVPIIVNFEGKEYEVGINLDNEFLYKNMTKYTKIKTSSVRLGDLENVMKEASENSEKVIYISLSKHLSASNSIANLSAKQFKNVLVFDSEFITPWLNYIIYDIAKLAKEGNFNSIVDKLNSFSGNMYGYLIPGNIDALYTGGRISKTQYLIGSLAKIVPIIPIQNGEISSRGVIKAKGIEKAISKVIKQIDEDVKGFKKQGFKIKLGLINCDNKKDLKLLEEAIKKSLVLKNFKTVYQKISPEIVAHIGPGSIAIVLILY